MKPVTPAAVYVAIIPLLTEVARKSGYALAVHGSLGRDLDVVAVPWVEDAASPETLILALLAAVGWNRAHLHPESTNQDGSIHQESGHIPTKKPHGRRAWSINFDNGLYLDVSVMPLAPEVKP
jgi:hypothetical protein